MSRFPLLTCTALVAVSVALAAPLPLSAQTPPATQTAEPLVWGTLERFGILLPVVEGAPIIEESDTADERSVAVSSIVGSAPGVLVGLRVLTALDLRDMPAPGSEGFADFLTQISGVPVEATEEQFDLGGRALHLYVGAGRRIAQDGLEVDGQAAMLVAHDLDAAGEGLMLALMVQGLDDATTAQIRAEFLQRLAMAPVSEAPAEAPAEAVPPSAAAPMTLVEGLAALSLSSGDVVVQTERSDQGLDLRLTNEQGQLLRVLAGVPSAGLPRQLRRFVDRVDGITEAEAGGVPVWRIDGVTDRPTIGRAEGGEYPVTLVVPQYCVQGDQGLAVAVVRDPGTGAEAVDGLLAGLSFTRPEGAAICADLAGLAEQMLAAPEVATAEPTPAPTEPPPAVAAAPVDAGKLPAGAPVVPAPEIVQSVPATPATPAIQPDLSPLFDEFALWTEAVSQNRAEGFWTYLKAFPNGQFVELARVMLQSGAAMPAMPVAPAPDTK